jgi:CRP-like cAMP-binding protein
VPIQKGSIFGEVGLISGRRRGATIVAASDCICVEISRNAALKLQSQVPSAGRAIERISTERQLLQMFGSGLTPDDVREVVDTAKIMLGSAPGDAIITEGADDKDIYVIRVGSMIVEKVVGGKPVFLSYLPAGSYVGEMALIDGGQRTATVRRGDQERSASRSMARRSRACWQRSPPSLSARASDMEARRGTECLCRIRRRTASPASSISIPEQAKFLVSAGPRRGD